MEKKENIIYDNCNFDLDDYKEFYADEYENTHGEEYTGDFENDPTFWEAVNFHLSNWLDDEMMNLDRQLDYDIIAIASVGTWRGSRRGYTARI